LDEIEAFAYSQRKEEHGNIAKLTLISRISIHPARGQVGT